MPPVLPVRERVDRRAVVRLFVPVARLLFLAPVRLADLAALVLRAVPVLFFAVARDLVAVERLVFAFVFVERAEVLRPVVLAARGAAAPSSSIGHLPDITRSAASETASAISAPNRVALAITELAAWLAVSAASIPASLIFLRAAGLALIAAAAAASPAASISLLIAALVSLSTVVLFDLVDFDDFVEEPLRLLDFAIADLPFGRPIDT